MGNALLQSVNDWKRSGTVTFSGCHSIQLFMELVPGLIVDGYSGDEVFFNYREKAQGALWSENAKNMGCRSKWHIVCCIFATSALGVCRRVNLLWC
tara:strand:+ start:113 stop:400 length:288 start_codon:yes stop_codon:yes gene_type:complete